MVGHDVQLQNDKADIITYVDITPQRQGIGIKVLEHFLKESEGKVNRVVISEVSFESQKRWEAILQKLKGSMNITWKPLDTLEGRHIQIKFGEEK